MSALRCLAAVAAFTLVAAALAQDGPTLATQGTAAYEAREYAKAAGLYVAAIERGLRGAGTPYNAACCFALTNQSDDAFKYLNLAIERGWRDLAHLEADEDFKSVRDDARWKAAVAACRESQEKYYKSLKEPELAKELLRRQELDQRLRRLLEAAMSKARPGEPGVRIADVPGAENLGNVDQENTEFMKQTIEKHGWPGKSLVGEEAAAAAWLLVQHADHDPEFQAKSLDLVKEAFKKGDVTGQQVAYLTDRVLLKQGKKQVYGTQFVGNGPDAKPAPIEDEANVDARRKEVGLPPLEEYAKLIRGLGAKP